MQYTLFFAGTTKVLLRVSFDPVQIIVVKCQASQRRVQGRRQILERGRIKTAEYRTPVSSGAWLAIAVENHTSVFMSGCQYQNL
ncbi:hypothetical protein D3C85_1485130 [compost metagenome]